MPVLNWIGKDKVVNHHIDVPFFTLEHKYGFRADDENDKSETHSGNMIIHGDNLVALKALLPQYEGKIDCIYIDPPYNTGEEKWKYNDNVNDPHIQKWIGETVGKDLDDFSRHDKWLCMMYPRLVLLHKMLSKQGVIFISIDDHEYSNLKTICDTIFGSDSFVSTFVWQKRYSRENREAIGDVHEYILLYAMDKKFFKENRNKIPMNEAQAKVYKNPNNDPKGRWRPVPMTAQAGHATKDQFYPITTPTGVVHYPPKGRCWSIMKETYDELLKQNRIYFGSDGNAQPNTIRYLSEVEGVVPWTWWPHEEVGNTDGAKKEIYSILGRDLDFETPKPSTLIDRIIEIATGPNSIILDSFAGSGVTAHSVLKQNEKDGGHRKFILIELLDYADEITAERVKRVCKGYSFKGKEEFELYSQELKMSNLKNVQKFIDEAKTISLESKTKYDKVGNPTIKNNCIKVLGSKNYMETIPGLGGSFDFYELGKPLFVEGKINEEVEEEIVRKYVYFTETRQPLCRERKKDAKFLLDTWQQTGYYFFYEKGKSTELNYETLDIVTEKADQYIIYANVCRLSKAFLQEKHIIFKRIPNDIKKF
jgi:adenine-specific DNA-methyltransferase